MLILGSVLLRVLCDEPLEQTMDAEAHSLSGRRRKTTGQFGTFEYVDEWETIPRNRKRWCWWDQWDTTQCQHSENWDQKAPAGTYLCGMKSVFKHWYWGQVRQDRGFELFHCDLNPTVIREDQQKRNEYTMLCNDLDEGFKKCLCPKDYYMIGMKSEYSGWHKDRKNWLHCAKNEHMKVEEDKCFVNGRHGWHEGGPQNDFTNPKYVWRGFETGHHQEDRAYYPIVCPIKVPQKLCHAVKISANKEFVNDVGKPKMVSSVHVDLENCRGRDNMDYDQKFDKKTVVKYTKSLTMSKSIENMFKSKVGFYERVNLEFAIAKFDIESTQEFEFHNKVTETETNSKTEAKEEHDIVTTGMKWTARPGSHMEVLLTRKEQLVEVMWSGEAICYDEDGNTLAKSKASGTYGTTEQSEHRIQVEHKPCPVDNWDVYEEATCEQWFLMTDPEHPSRIFTKHSKNDAILTCLETEGCECVVDHNCNDDSAVQSSGSSWKGVESHSGTFKFCKRGCKKWLKRSPEVKSCTHVPTPVQCNCGSTVAEVEFCGVDKDDCCTKTSGDFDSVFDGMSCPALADLKSVKVNVGTFKLDIYSSPGFEGKKFSYDVTAGVTGVTKTFKENQFLAGTTEKDKASRGSIRIRWTNPDHTGRTLTCSDRSTAECGNGQTCQDGQVEKYFQKEGQICPRFPPGADCAWEKSDLCVGEVIPSKKEDDVETRTLFVGPQVYRPSPFRPEEDDVEYPKETDVEQCSDVENCMTSKSEECGEDGKKPCAMCDEKFALDLENNVCTACGSTDGCTSLTAECLEALVCNYGSRRDGKGGNLANIFMPTTRNIFMRTPMTRKVRNADRMKERQHQRKRARGPVAMRAMFSEDDD